MKKRVMLALLLAAGISFARDGEPRVEKKSVVINVGTARVIALPFTPGEVLKGDLGPADIDPETGLPGDITPGNTIFEAKWKGRKVRIRGLKTGTGNLEVMDKRGRKRMVIWVYISTPHKGRLVTSLRRLLRDVEGVRISVSNNDVTIDGELFRQKDKERIDQIVEKYTTDGVKIINLTSYSPIFMQAMAKKIERELNDPQIHVKPLKDKFMLLGTITYIASESEKDKEKDENARKSAVEKSGHYEKIANAYVGEKNYVGSKDASSGAQIIVNAIKIVMKKESQTVDKLIRIQFDFVELAKTYMKKFGFKWSPGIHSGEKQYSAQQEWGMLGDKSTLNVGPGGITSVITGTIRNLFPKLFNAKQFGHAKVLESAQVMTKNDTEARFKSGRSVVLPTMGDKGTVSYDQPTFFGLTSTYKPTIIGENKAVSIVTAIKYNSLPPGGIIAPGSNLPEHEYNATLIIEPGQSVAVAGMISNISGKMFDRIPEGIENSFFNIYHSKDFLHNKSQMIMFITPTIIENAAAGSNELKRKFRVK